MSAEKIQLPPCAGEYEGDGCEAFERYAKNEVLFIETDTDDLRYPLLGQPALLRQRLLSDFVADGHCVLLQELKFREENASLPDGVTSLVRPRDIVFAGCQKAVRLREHDGGPRLFDSVDMDNLIDTLRPGGRLTNNDMTRCFTGSDEVFQDRVSEYRDVLENEEADIPARIEAAGALLFYFYDSPSLDTASRLFFDRLIHANHDRSTILELGDPEWDAWHKLIVGLDYFEALTPHIGERFAEALLVNGFDSGIEVVKRAAQQTYQHLSILLANEVAQRTGFQAKAMTESVDRVSLLFIDLIALKTNLDLSSAGLIREFSSPPDDAGTVVEQTTLRLVE